MPKEVELAFESRALTVNYGGVVANDAVDLVIRPGEVVGLIGPNGAGKTTFIDGATGFAPSTGEVRVCGAGVEKLPPYRRRKLGLARTWQSGELFADLSVAGNLSVAEEHLTFRAVLRDLLRPRRNLESGAVDEALAAVGLVDVGDRRPTDLSLGEQKLVGVARSLIGGAKVLLLDEPAAGLDSDESKALGHRLREVAGSGVSILLVDHDMGLVLEFCDRIYVLDFGKVICVGTPSEITEDEAVVHAYLGTPDADLRAPRR